MGLLDLIANTYHDIGQQKLDAGLRSGQIWGNALASLGQIPGQIQQQKMQDQQIQTSQLQNQVTQAQLTGLQQAQAGQAKADAILADPAVRNPDGTFNTDVLTQKLSAAGVSPTVQANYLKALDEINTSTTKTHEARLNHAGDIANAALQGHDASNPMTPEEAQLVLATAVASGAATKDEIAPFTQQLANGADPTKLFQSVKSFAPKYGGQTKYGATTSGAIYGVEGPEGGKIVGQATGQPKNEAELASDAADPNSPTAARSSAALAMLKKSQAGSAEQDDQRYRNIQAALIQKKDVSPDDLAWAKGYEQQKTLGPEASAAAAADRLASTQAATNARLDKTENFQEKEAGRVQLAKNVETPYLTARASADTLRDTVAAAKSGNKVAASLQSLEATMGAIRSQGLNRINTAEIGVTAGAGDIWDRIVGWVGKADAGQPVPENIQKDMTEFADILDKAAYKKYSDGFDATTKRYKLTDEQKIAAPAAGSPSVQTRTATVNGQKVTFTKGPTGWTAPGINGVYDDAGKLIKGGG